MQQKPPRPTGVTILGVLAILGGIALLFSGAVLIGLGLLLGTLVASVDITNAINNAGYPGLASLGVGVISAIVIVLGVVALISVYFTWSAESGSSAERGGRGH